MPLNIFVETIFFFRMFWWIESSEEQKLFEIDFFVTLEMSLLSLLINLLHLWAIKWLLFYFKKIKLTLIKDTLVHSILFCIPWKKVIELWHNMIVNRWQQNLNFEWTLPSRNDIDLNSSCINKTEVVSFSGSGCVGYGSDSLLFRVWEGMSWLIYWYDQNDSSYSSLWNYLSGIKINAQASVLQWHLCDWSFWSLICLTSSPSPLFFFPVLQCPFIDEYILALHNKIKCKPVEFPET